MKRYIISVYLMSSVGFSVMNEMFVKKQSCFYFEFVKKMGIIRF